MATAAPTSAKCVFCSFWSGQRKLVNANQNVEFAGFQAKGSCNHKPGKSPRAGQNTEAGGTCPGYKKWDAFR